MTNTSPEQDRANARVERINERCAAASGALEVIKPQPWEEMTEEHDGIACDIDAIQREIENVRKRIVASLA